jgi:hypothetical protein
MVSSGGDMYELHDFAKKIGLLKRYFVANKAARLSYYLLWPEMRTKAIKAGAHKADPEQLKHVLLALV